jgi:hypothetical protein
MPTVNTKAQTMTLTENYLKQPNLVGKFVYPSLSHAETKTFAFILQQTNGWNRESAAITTSFLQAGSKDQMGTGLSRSGQRKAITELLTREWIAITEYETLFFSGRTMQVPVYQICWATIQRDYEAWQNSAVPSPQWKERSFLPPQWKGTVHPAGRELSTRVTP